MKITAILPVFNEEKTIENVLTILNKSKLINDIVVVDDASSDSSLKKIKKFKSKKIKIIHLKKNLGKSGAVKVAAKNLKTDVLFFCDGDLHNFQEKHIEEILEPLKYEKIAMSAGLRDYGSLLNFLCEKTFPLITGERALSYPIFEEVVKHEPMKDYDLEPILNDYCKRNNIPIYKKIMKGLRQTNKPVKRKNGIYLYGKQGFEIGKRIIILKMRRIKKGRSKKQK